MRLRIVSDLHIDINARYAIDFSPLTDPGAFTLVAGDVCGATDEAVAWLRSHVVHGAFCAGNHIVYNNAGLPIEDIKRRLHEEFPADADIAFLDEEVGVIAKDLGENVLLVGDVMYTDYKLRIPGFNDRGLVGVNMAAAVPGIANGGLNDFNWGLTMKKMYERPAGYRDLPPTPWSLRPEYYHRHFLRAFRAVERVVEANPTKDVVLMTHHCLSPKCLSGRYVSSHLAASYVSNRERWILAHPNIRLVVSGHVHHRTSFRLGGTLYVTNPLGYFYDTYMQRNDETGESEAWTPNCFVDTETWTLSREPARSPALELEFRALQALIRSSEAAVGAD